MKFNSVASLVRFLGALCSIGYVVPFCDYSKELIKHGFTKHIHCYTVIFDIDSLLNISLTFVDKDNKYIISIMKGLAY